MSGSLGGWEGNGRDFSWIWVLKVNTASKTSAVGSCSLEYTKTPLSCIFKWVNFTAYELHSNSKNNGQTFSYRILIKSHCGRCCHQRDPELSRRPTCTQPQLCARLTPSREGQRAIHEHRSSTGSLAVFNLILSDPWGILVFLFYREGMLAPY